ncbi:polycystic kidney disease protein 1-like 2 [Mya arenaria]|uniref:polycystic kidney disease protein 1-like 2 n=1 Tax=Mya arenaria TaxID=6604 RepID=UPI0022E4334C|nr:polycystic kidney disease protein 1-like 2 [Mya arenaria]
MDVMQTDQEVDGPPITIVTPSIYLSMNKMKPGNLTRISMEPVKTNGSKISLTIPDDLDLTGNNDSISMQYMYTKKNPYSWKESVAMVTSGVQSLTLKDSHNKPVHMNNLKSPLKLSFDFDDVATSAKIPLKLIIQKQGKTFDQVVRHARPGTTTFNITLTRGNTQTFVLDLPQNLSSIKLGISEEGEVNIKELVATGFRYPGDIELINAMYGRGNGDGGDVLDNITRYCQECDHRCCKDNTTSCIGIYAGCGMFCSHLPNINMTANCTDLNEDLTAKDTPGNVISGKTIYLSAREPKLEESNVTSYVLYFTVSVDITDTQTREELMLRDPGCLGNETISECYVSLDLTTTLRSFHLGCYYWDVEKDDWTQEGMQISDKSLSSSPSIECLTSHLSSFGASVLVAPTFVDPDDIVLFLTFFENPVVVTAVIMLWIVYFFLIHWAKRYDRRDVEQVGVIPCVDNKQGDQYVYLVCFITGWWKHAGTSANVYFYMTGTDGVSGKKHVNTADRVCLQPGSEDWLVVTTEHSLGHISSITVWHDNTGSNPHWYLNQVHIKDVETGSSWNYIYNDWLAVDMGSLLSTTATIEATSEDQMRVKLKYKFMIQFSREIRNGHLWISIFSKSPASQFTRVQRLTCALSLLLSTMLTNLMFYGIPTDEPADQVKAGPFSLTLSQIVIGIESSLIMFPVNLLMIQLFMKVKPRERKMRRKMKDPDETFIASFNASMTDKGSTQETVSAMTVDFDLKKNIQRQLDIDLFRLLYTDALRDRCRVVPNLVTKLLIENLPDRFSWSVAGEALDMNVVLDNQGQFTLAPREKDTGGKEDLALKPNRSDLSLADDFYKSALKFDSCGDIGHTTRSPTISMSGDASSQTASEIKRFSTESIFSKDRCVLDEAPVVVRARKDPRFLPWWFLYVAWTVAISVCLVSSFVVMLYGLKFGYTLSIEWLVSFVTGFLQSVLVQQPLKTLVVVVLLTMIFKKDVEFEDVGADMELDNDEEYLCSVNPKPDSHLSVAPPLPQRMMEAIKQRLKFELLMDLTICDMILHFIYLTVVILMLTGHRNITTSFQTTRAVRTVMVGAEHGMPFKKVNSIGGVYQYLEDTVIPVMKVASQYGRREISTASEFFLVGPYRLRQLRVGDSCTPEIVKGLPVGCQPSYSLIGEDSGNYKKSWSIPLLDEDYAINPWIHQSGWSLKTLPFVGSHATYSGGGYVLPLSGQEQRDTDSLEDLETRGWIDRNTRAVFLEFTFYNPNVDMFTVGVYMFEFTNTGGVYPSHQEISTSLHHYSSSYGKFVAVCEVLFAAFNLTFIIIEVKKFRKQGKSEYFSSIWTIIELCQIGMAVAVVVMFVQRVLAVGSVMDDFKSSKGETFVSFYPAVFWDAVLMYVMGGLMTTVILITIKLLIFNRKMFLLSYTLSAVHMHLLSFLLIFAITTFAFAAFSYLLFNSVFRGYKTLGDALVSNVSLLMGIADFVGLYEYNRIIGVVFLFSFVFTVYFGVMTFVQAILNVGRIEARDRIKGKKNHLDHINYITSKLKMLVQQK